MQKNFEIRASIKQLLTKYQIFTILPQISHFYKYRNFSSIFCNFLHQLLHPYKFYGRDVPGILFFIFASFEPLNNIYELLFCIFNFHVNYMLRNDALLPRATHTTRPILRSRELRMRYRTRERRPAQKNSTLPPRGNTNQNRQFRLRECYQDFTSPQAEILYLFRFTVPFAVMHIKIFIPPRGNTIWNWQFRLRGCNQNIAFPRAEIL